MNPKGGKMIARSAKCTLEVPVDVSRIEYEAQEL
jgi:hypothetical protein